MTWRTAVSQGLEARYRSASTGLRATADIQALGFHQPPSRAYLKTLGEGGLSRALSERDRPFGDYRTAGEES